ncbi:MAG: pyridoxamine 5'-phosphate oxidase family protein [Erysipelotrichaceae bacterium]|nr:pyridoxamine 5'-phosphate oxidase family protein [Erysipelotrichaceae bacterium]
MERLEEIYGEDLLMIFKDDQLKDHSYKMMAVIRSGVRKKDIEDTITFNYDENFEDALSYKVPPKTRKPYKLLSYTRIYEILERVTFGAIGCLIDDMPYTYTMNYVVLDGHIYFHTGRKGYKLLGLDQKASFNVVEDLGIAYNGTHNFRSVQVYGTLKATEDHDLKKRILQKYIDHLNPAHPKYVESMQESTLVYEIETDYIIGKEHLFLPGDGK